MRITSHTNISALLGFLYLRNLVFSDAQGDGDGDGDGGKPVHLCREEVGHVLHRIHALHLNHAHRLRPGRESGKDRVEYFGVECVSSYVSILDL